MNFALYLIKFSFSPCSTLENCVAAGVYRRQWGCKERRSENKWKSVIRLLTCCDTREVVILRVANRVMASYVSINAKRLRSNNSLMELQRKVHNSNEKFP